MQLRKESIVDVRLSSGKGSSDLDELKANAAPTIKPRANRVTSLVIRL